MAIQFARCQFVSRSTGGNACRKAAYNQRESVLCDRTGELFSFKGRAGNVHHEILLPNGASEAFKNSTVLWNEAEHSERRKNSQVAREFVLALPDDKEVTLEDRIELTRRFAQGQFADRGVAVQCDIHAPHEGDQNWHAHLLVTTRRFTEDGQSLGLKARDLNPEVRSKKVIEGDLWGEIWRDVQNGYFEEKGYDVRVDPIGVLTQEHLGPVRMRHHMNDALARAQLLQKANEELSRDPGSVIAALTRTQAILSEKDVGMFLDKHVPSEDSAKVFEGVMNHSSCVPLYDKETGQLTPYFTTQEIRAEEEKLMRFSDKIAQRSVTPLSSKAVEQGLEGKTLTEEQRQAYRLATSGNNLSLIQGRAGVGKSYLLDSIRKSHETDGYRVLGLAPTHKVALDLKDSGFKESKTCHAFLFAIKNNRETLNDKTLVVVDEAGMLGTELSVELFHAVKTSGAKLVLVGDDRQLPSVERGGVFKALIERYDSAELSEVRRQSMGWQKDISEDLSKGNVQSAVQLLQEQGALKWNGTKEEALADLLTTWATSRDLNPKGSHQILAQKNVHVDALNQGAREILRDQGKLGEEELTCMTGRGRASFAEGDRIQLTTTDKSQGLVNGWFGTVETLHEKTKTLTVRFDNGVNKNINPGQYDGLRHGYASTVYKAQGSTLDHVFVLHSNTSNQATNYVALTRQTKSLSLFVAKEETPNEAALISQMSRETAKGTSLAFDTQKDIERRKEEKSFTTHVKEGVENLVTKVKDTFHENEGFYRFDKPKTLDDKDVTIRPASLQSVYDEMKHPALSSGDALAVRHAFEKGMKIHGEEKAIQYWESKREELLKGYQASLNKVDQELGSPLMAHVTKEWKNQARTYAQQDPGRMLNLIESLKEDELHRREKMAEELRTTKVETPHYTSFKQQDMSLDNHRFDVTHEQSRLKQQEPTPALNHQKEDDSFSISL